MDLIKKKLSKILIALVILSAGGSALAAKETKTTASSPTDWNHWYTVTILPNTPYAYYHETLEKNQGRLHFKTEMWKREEGFINSEQLGVFSEDNALLTPLFYNFHANYRESELNIDGSVNQGRLQVRIKRNQQDLPVITRGMPKNAFFSSMFPIWMSRKLQEAPASTASSLNLSFLAILEDNQDAGFSAQSGRFKVATPDEFSKSTSTVPIQVDFNGQKSLWYLDKKGAPIRVEIPGQRTRIERVPEKQAQAFLKTS
jgi:hypothetical protein